MTTKEKVIELLELFEYDIPVDDGKEYTLLDFMDKKELSKIVDALEKAGLLKQEWISVKDRLPDDKHGYPMTDDDHIGCLIMRHGRIELAQWSLYHKVWDSPDCDDFMYDSDEMYLTHWQPLPAAPEK